MTAADLFERDVELLHCWQQGDRRAGSQLYGRYKRCVQRFFINKTRSEGEHGDLVHDTFLALTRVESPRCPMKRIDDADLPLRPFVLGVAHNVFRNHIRGAARRGRRELDLGEHTLGELQPGVSSVFRARRQAQALMSGLRSIPIEDQILLELKYFEHISLQEIAEVLGVGLTSLNGRVTRAKQRLCRQVQACAAIDAAECGPDALDAWAEEIRGLLTKKGALR
jgi:RNA polymerase sigma factor (sigma-70 family)